MDRTVPAALQTKVRAVYQALMTLTGGSKRQGQLQMIGAIANAVANAKRVNEPGTGARLLAINAPVGSGKTTAYAIGVIPMAMANGLKVVLTTGKVALQEQLYGRDLPTLQKVLPEMRFALVKGRARYACNVRLSQVQEEGAGEAARVAAKLLKDLDSGAWNGDADDLPSAPAKEVWAQFTNDKNGCAGRKCSAFARCPYYLNRKAVEQADVLVANHDILIADIRAGHSVLPKPGDAVWVVDEAHHLPSKAVSALGNGHTLDDALQFVMRCGALIASIRKTVRSAAVGALAVATMDAIKIMGGTLKEARLAVDSLGQTTEMRDPKRPVRFKGGKLPQWLAKASADCRTTSEAAAASIKLLMESLQGEEGDELPVKTRERLLSEVGQAAGRISRIVGVWKLMTEEPGKDGPVAKWVEVCASTHDIRVCASPVGVGEYLHEALWSKAAAAIHLSGTMTTVGGFAPYLKASGLDRTDGVRTLSVETPFDYAAQAELIVPHDACNPKDGAGHTQWLINNIPDMVEQAEDGTGCLVLFSSLSQLREVASGMPRWVQQMLLTQDRMSRRELLKQHEKAITAGNKSVIFGAASYEEGLDLPGRLCSLVVIAKLQFSVPSDPVAQALQEYLEEQGLSHFTEVAVPEACRRLMQSAGRLVRTETDTGRVVVADPRLVGTPFGRRMLAQLPPYQFSRQLRLAA